MAKSRYFPTPTILDTQVLEPLHYATWSVPARYQGYLTPDFLDDQNYYEHVWKFGDRIDRLADKYFGEGEYWWIIMICNGLSYSLNIPVGTVLRIPVDIRPILEKLDII